MGLGRILRLAQLCLLTLGLLLVSSRALAAYTPPPLEGPVTDPARALSDTDKRVLNAKLRAHKVSTGVGINVFIPATLGDDSIEDVAYNTARTWKLGTGGTDEGVLLVWAPKERKVRIETAKGIGDRLTDVESFHIIRDIMTPKLKAGQNRQALEDGVDAIAKAIGPRAGAGTTPGSTQPSKPASGASPGRALAGGALVLIILIGGGGLLFVVFLVFVLKKLFSSGRRDQSYYAHHHDPYVQNPTDYGTPGVFYTGGSDNSSSSDWGGGGSSDSGGGGSDWGGGGDSGGGDWGGGGSSGDY